MLALYTPFDRVTKATDLIQEFAAKCHELLLAMEDSDFVNHVTSMVKQREEIDLALEDEVRRNWSEVVTREYVFDRLHKEVNVIHYTYVRTVQ